MSSARDSQSRRRLGVVSSHLGSSDTSGIPEMRSYHVNACTGGRDSVVPHASATGQSSSYSRVHGHVSTHNVEWIGIPSVGGSSLQETIYKKSKGEYCDDYDQQGVQKKRFYTFNHQGIIDVGGDQSVRGKGGYVGADGVPRLNVLDLQIQIRRLPKPVIAMVAGYAVGGGNILQMVCDITIAADNAVFGQTGPKVGSFDAGYGSTHMARLVGQKKAREIWFLCRLYSAKEALEMGLVNTVVPLCDLEKTTVQWSREMLKNSPTALRLIKSALNAAEDGQAGIQQLGGDATMLFYQSEEGDEGRKAFLEKRPPNFESFKRNP
eukprot:jgi/Picre1/29407/NNA_004795.t1